MGSPALSGVGEGLELAHQGESREGLLLDLSHALPREAEVLADLAERLRVTAAQPVPQREHVTLPFRESSEIRFQLTETSPVSLRIYSADGRSVRQLLHGERAAGYHSVPWDGRDDQGRLLSQGIYFVRFETGGYQMTKRTVLLR